MISEYDDILSHPRHRSSRRKQMSLADRAAQFAPFAALSGYGDCITEKGRLTTPRKNLGEDQQDMLDRKLQYLTDMQARHPWVIIVYYIPDNQKAGGYYEQISGTLKKIDPVRQVLILEDYPPLHLGNVMDILLTRAD